MTDRTPFGTQADPERNPWDWGVVVTPDGEIIPPGACDGYHNKANQRELLK